MNNSVFFTVIITTYQRAELVETAIKSVLNQEFTDFELLVVDDGSTDNTKTIINGIEDSRLQYTYQENQGVSEARNNGIKLSKGKYICFLDDDDTYKSNHLQAFYNYITIHNNPIGLLRTYAEIHHIAKPSYNQKIIKQGNEHLIEFLMTGANLYTPNICIPCEVFDKFLFNRKYIPTEDYEMWLRIASEYPLIEIPEYTTNIYFREKSLSTGSEGTHKVYIKAWTEIFLQPYNAKHISIKTKQKTLFKRYVWLAVEQSKNKKTIKSLISCIQATGKQPFFILNKKFYSIIIKSI